MAVLVELVDGIIDARVGAVAQRVHGKLAKAAIGIRFPGPTGSSAPSCSVRLANMLVLGGAQRSEADKRSSDVQR